MTVEYVTLAWIMSTSGDKFNLVSMLTILVEAGQSRISPMILF